LKFAGRRRNTKGRGLSPSTLGRKFFNTQSRIKPPTALSEYLTEATRRRHFDLEALVAGRYPTKYHNVMLQ
jgi:hypothetical protein